jgi:rhodanese-related sulfurtransferase
VPPLTHPEDLHDRLDQGDTLHVVDVRSPAEYESAHIPGSHNLPLDRLGEVTDHLADLDAPLVLVCRSGKRAEQAAEHLREHLGHHADRLVVLDGGVDAWDDGRRPVRRGKGTWELERQVRLVAGSLVLGSILTSTVAPRAKWVAGAVGGGLTFAALSDTCAMGMLLSKLPHNRRHASDPVAVARAMTSGR